MVKNNASTSYDMTDKSITPLVRVKSQRGCVGLVCMRGAGVWGIAVPQEPRPSEQLPGETKPCLLASSEPPLQTADSGGCHWVWPHSQTSWARTPAAVRAGEGDSTSLSLNFPLCKMQTVSEVVQERTQGVAQMLL